MKTYVVVYMRCLHLRGAGSVGGDVEKRENVEFQIFHNFRVGFFSCLQNEI